MKPWSTKAILFFCLALALTIGRIVPEGGSLPLLALAQDSAPTLTAIAYAGMSTPVGGVFQSDVTMTYGRAFFDVNMNDDGDVVFAGQVYKNGSYLWAIFLYDGETKELAKIVAEGDPNPYGTTFEGVRYPFLIDGDGIVFTASFRTPPTNDFPQGRQSWGLFFYLGGSISPIVTAEQVVFQEGSLDGYFNSFSDADINNRGDIVLDGTIAYYERGPYKGPGHSSPVAWEGGVYLLPAGGAAWQEVMIEGNPAPEGGYISEERGDYEFGSSVWVSDVLEASDGIYIARNNSIGDASSAYSSRAILLRSPDGTLSRVVSSGDLLPRKGLPGEQEVQAYMLRLVGVNSYGQVGAIVTEPDNKHHFYIFPQGGAYRVAGWGDQVPDAEQEGMIFETYADMMAAINDNQVPVGTGFNAEAVFMTPVLNQRTGFYYQDVYSYTTDGVIRPVASGDDAAPDPPGGILFHVRYSSFDLARLALNNQGLVVIDGFVQLDTNDRRNVLLLASLDSDGDGLLDVWERDGIDANNDGTVDLTLSTMGANPQHKDIFVEIDYMNDGGHSHRPLDGAISDVIRAFADAPVDNPDGTRGINLHVLVNEQLPANTSLKMWVDFDALKASYFGTVWERSHPNSANILKALSFVYRYAIFGHQYQYWDDSSGTWQLTTSSGMAELPGNDFLVSLGAFTNDVGSREEQAGTFMHEMGHTLGLRHGGGDDINAKPNYLSIMSYTRQFPHFIDTRPLDYSQKQLLAINENSLDETAGIGGEAGDNTVFFVDTNRDGYNDSFARVAGNGPINWNWDRDSTDTAFDRDLNSLISGFDAGGSPVWDFDGVDKDLQLLTGYDDWANLRYDFRRTPDFADGMHPDDIEIEMTWELVTSLRALKPLSPSVEYTLTLAANGSGSSEPAAGAYTYEAGTVVDITAAPDAGWQFVNWTGDVTDPNAATTTVTMNTDKTVTANFSQVVTQYTLTMAVSGNGSSNPAVGAHTYETGTVVTITATPDTGWRFVNWTGDVADPNAATTTVTMNADKTATATFISWPNIAVTPASLAFGPVLVGAPSSPLTLTMTNTGSADLTVGTITIGGTDAALFSIQSDNVSGQTLIPGVSANLKIVFMPTTTTPNSATLSIPSDDPDQPVVSVSLTGQGEKKKKGLFSCSRGSGQEKTSASELAVGWAVMGLCWGAGHYLTKRLTRGKRQPRKP